MSKACMSKIRVSGLDEQNPVSGPYEQDRVSGLYEQDHV